MFRTLQPPGSVARKGRDMCCNSFMAKLFRDCLYLPLVLVVSAHLSSSWLRDMSVIEGWLVVESSDTLRDQYYRKVLSEY